MKWNDNLEVGSPAHVLASSTDQTVRSMAGPGTGKSFGIQRRIAKLMDDGVRPEKILAITFTRTAANDLKKDIGSMEVSGSENVVAKTIHSHALSILMRADIIEKTHRTPRMILEHEMKGGLHDLGKEKYGTITERKILRDSYLAAWATLQIDEAGFTKEQKQIDFESDVTGWMKQHSGMLIGEVIPEVIKYLKFNPASDAIGAYDVILVDEYQDLNKAEQEFIKLIRGDASIVIVGDDDQSIYKFKYAHPAGIQTIEQLHGKYTDIPFEQCRRCPTRVTKMASELIGKNSNRTLGELMPFDKNPEGDVKIIQWKNYKEEIPGIVKIIQQELKEGLIAPKDILILSPRRLIGYQLRDQLLYAEIPVQSYFREDAIKKLPVQRAYSLINLLAFPNDSISLRFLLGAGSSDFRAGQYKKLLIKSEEKNVSVRGILDLIVKGELEVIGLTTILEEYKKILQEIIRIRQALKDEPENLFDTVFIKGEELEVEFYEFKQIYLDILAKEGTEQAKNDETQPEWINKIFSKIQEQVTNPEIPDDIDHVRIMSLHSSKGLSAKFVILCSMVDELMPFISKDLSAEVAESQFQEQRRLFYVAVTRCKADTVYDGKLIISSFLNIPGKKALALNIPSKANVNRKVTSTRFIQDFRDKAPTPILGNQLFK
ncbi:MAG: UvrD-helicase domain-containing protein [Nitrospinales bacterium]